MAAKEAKARIKINKLLEESGWRFFDDAKGKTNSVVEPKVRLTKMAVDALGEKIEKLKEFNPLPPLATQQAVVAEIEAEQALVATNRELIARFEKKIQATLTRVWDEEEPPQLQDTEVSAKSLGTATA